MKEKQQTAQNRRLKKLTATSARPLVRVARKLQNRLDEHRRSSPYRSFRLTRRSEIPRYLKVPAWWRLCVRTFRLLKSQWKKTVVLIVAYAALAWVVSGVYSQNFTNAKLALDALGEGVLSGGEEAFLLFTSFFQAQSLQVSQDALVVLNLVGVFFWLSFVWIARYAYAKKKTTIVEALYTSGTAFVPFLLIGLLFAVQLLPVAVAGLLLSSLQGTGFTGTDIETALFITLSVLLVVFSLYFMVSTTIALQIVALPGMRPWRALRNARKLIAGKRFSVLRKLVMLVAILFVVWVGIFVPMLLLDNAVCDDVACWSTYSLLPLTYYLLVGFTLAFVSSYTYIMYRALLEDNTEELV